MTPHEHIIPGEEASFVVHRTRRKMGVLQVHFTGELSEVLALKRAVPEFHDVTSLKLAKIVRAGLLDLGPYVVEDARERVRGLEREGLRYVLTSFVQEGGLLVDERGPVVHLIEDAKENRRVIEDAIRRCVRVVEREIG
jgi:hypothetical protein